MAFLNRSLLKIMTSQSLRKQYDSLCPIFEGIEPLKLAPGAADRAQDQELPILSSNQQFVSKAAIFWGRGQV